MNSIQPCALLSCAVLLISGCGVTSAQLDAKIAQLRAELASPSSVIASPLVETGHQNLKDFVDKVGENRFRVKFSKAFADAIRANYPELHPPLVLVWIVRHGNSGGQYNLPPEIGPVRVTETTQEHFIFELTLKRIANGHPEDVGVNWIAAGQSLRK